MDPKRPILILYSKFIFSILSLNVSKMFAITNPKSNFLFWESGGSRVIRLTIWAGGSYPRNGRPLIKKKLWPLKLMTRLHHWEMVGRQDVIVAKNNLLSEFATLLHFIAKVYFHVLRHFCSSVKANSTLSKLSPSVLGRRRRPFIALIPNIGPDNLYISFYTLMSTQNQSL